MSEVSGVPRSYPATLKAGVRHEIVIKKSRFLTRIEPVASVADAEAVIAEVKKQYWDARHNCSAMVTGLLADQARSSDDGEPGGTAGIPMLEVLRRRGLTDVVAVVTRYFGGIKLGAGGLIRAYSGAVAETLDLATLRRRRELTRVRVDVPHAEAGRADNLLRDAATRLDGVIGTPDYAEHATFELWVPAQAIPALRAELAEASSGEWEPRSGSTRIVDLSTS